MIGPLIALTPEMLKLEEPSKLELTNEDNYIRLLAAEYHLKTELHDLTLPGYWSNHNEWIPMGDYLSFSARFANQQRRYATNGLSPESFKKFQTFGREYARFSLERLKEEIKYLQNSLK